MIGAVWRQAGDDAVVVCAAGGLPGELHRLWRPKRPGGYHLEYGFSCMGYEIAGGLGVKMADPSREVIVMLGDGSYLMMNSEIATSVMLGLKLTIVVLDNRGFGCINRLQQSVGGAPFNNLFADARHETLPEIDFAAHAASLGGGLGEGGRHRRPGGRDGSRPGLAAHLCDRHRHRSRSQHRGRRRLVGRARCRRSRSAPQVAAARTAYEGRLEARRSSS